MALKEIPIKACKQLTVHYSDYALSHWWTVQGFTQLEHEFLELLRSIKCTTGPNDDNTFYLGIYPKGSTDQEYLAIYLYTVSISEQNMVTKLNFSIVNDENEEVKPWASRRLPVLRQASNGSEKFVLRSQLLVATTKLLSNDAFKVLCKVNILEMIPAVISINVLGNKIANDLAALFKCRKYSDVTIVTRGREFCVHKAILAARSPVFGRMLERKMEEQKLIRIDVDDVNSNVMEEILRFIYTGKAANMIKMAGGLLAAADKYNLDDLKLLCTKDLFTAITIDTAATVLTLADDCNVDMLKLRALDFVVAHAMDVMNTAGYESMITSHPHLIHEAFYKFVKINLGNRQNDQSGRYRVEPVRLIKTRETNPVYSRKHA